MNQNKLNASYITIDTGLVETLLDSQDKLDDSLLQCQEQGTGNRFLINDNILWGTMIFDYLLTEEVVVQFRHPGLRSLGLTLELILQTH